MASSIIHIAVANEINKELKRDKSRILIGTIAPDISKHIGEGKKDSHFLDDGTKDIPNMQKFLSKYAKYLDDDFVLGYYIHLYTDYLWFKYFIPDIYDESKDLITKIDESTEDVSIGELEDKLELEHFDDTEEQEPVDKTMTDSTLEHDLFNLIDSMYDDKEE